jgi:hypothetical protein
MTSATRLASLSGLPRMSVCASLMGGKLQFPISEDPFVRSERRARRQYGPLLGKPRLRSHADRNIPQVDRESFPAALVWDAVGDKVDVRLVACQSMA